MTKADLRRDLLKRRALMDSRSRALKSRAIGERLKGLKEYSEARVIGLFASFGSEVQTSGIIEDALGRGKMVVLPRVDRAEGLLKLYWIQSLSELSPGTMGIPEPEPLAEREVKGHILELVVVPGVAFDERGGRIGYGGGYYDRLLAPLKGRVPIVAVGFEEQMVHEVPLMAHDVRVDIIVTESRVIYCDGC